MNTKLMTPDDINALVLIKRGSDQALREMAESNRKAGDAMREAVRAYNTEFWTRLRAELGVESLSELFPEFTIEIETGRYSRKTKKKYTVHFMLKGEPNLFYVSHGFDRHTFSLNETGCGYLYSSLVDKAERSPPTTYGFNRHDYAQYDGTEKVRAAAAKVAAQMIAEFNLTTITCYK